VQGIEDIVIFVNRDTGNPATEGGKYNQETRRYIKRMTLYSSNFNVSDRVRDRVRHTGRRIARNPIIN
jgi:hypothetical protein